MNITDRFAELIDIGRKQGYSDEVLRKNLIANSIQAIDWALGDRVELTSAIPPEGHNHAT